MHILLLAPLQLSLFLLLAGADPWSVGALFSQTKGS